jgi:hypothetical protein
VPFHSEAIRRLIEIALATKTKRQQTPSKYKTNPFSIDWPVAIEHSPLEFIDENGGVPGVRLRKRHQKKSWLHS